MAKKTAAPRRETPRPALNPKVNPRAIRPAQGQTQVTAADIPGTAQHARRELRRQEAREHPPAARPQGIRVQATKDGYFGHKRRRVGDVFTIRTEQQFSTKWMTKVDAATRERITTPNQVIAKKHDETLALKYGGRPGTVSPDDTAAAEPADFDDEESNPLGAE